MSQHYGHVLTKRYWQKRERGGETLEQRPCPRRLTVKPITEGAGREKIIAQVILFPPLTLLSRLDPDSFGQTVNESGNRQLEGQADFYLATKMIASCLSLTSGQRVQEIIQRS